MVSRSHVACGQISHLLLLLLLLLRLGLQPHCVLALGLELAALQVLRQLDRLHGILAAGIGIEAAGAHVGALEAHGRHLRGVGVLGRRRCLHALGAHLRGRKVLVLHGGRGGVGKGLLLGEAKLGLLRGRLGAREGGAGRVALLGYRRRQWERTRAVHLRGSDCAGVDEAGGIVHGILG